MNFHKASWGSASSSDACQLKHHHIVHLQYMNKRGTAHAEEMGSCFQQTDLLTDRHKWGLEALFCSCFPPCWVGGSVLYQWKREAESLGHPMWGAQDLAHSLIYLISMEESSIRLGLDIFNMLMIFYDCKPPQNYLDIRWAGYNFYKSVNQSIQLKPIKLISSQTGNDRARLFEILPFPNYFRSTRRSILQVPSTKELCLAKPKIWAFSGMEPNLKNINPPSPQ